MADRLEYLTHRIAAGRDLFVTAGIGPQYRGNVNRDDGRFGKHGTPPLMTSM